MSSSLFKTSLRLSVMSAALVSVLPGVVHAGFEWVPEKKSSAYNSVKAPEEAVQLHVTQPQPILKTVEPEVVVESETMTPMVIHGDAIEEEVTAAPSDVIKSQNFYVEETVEVEVSAELPEEDKVSPTVEDVVNVTPVIMDEPVIAKPVIINSRYIVAEDAPESVRAALSQQAEYVEVKKAEALTEEPIVEVAAEDAVSEAVVVQPVIDEPVAVNASEEYEDMLQGFGNDLPLALAMRQIVPAKYAFSFSSDVNVGASVSWRGGKPWMSVLQETLKPLGLEAHLNGRTVLISTVDATKVMEEPLEILNSSEKHEPIALLEMPQSVDVAKSKKITDPGRVASKQPQSTINALVSMKNMDPASLNKIETAAGSAEVERTPRVILSKKNSKFTSQSWNASKGDSLKDTLSSWSETGAYELVWESDYDYSLASDFNSTGAFAEALASMMQVALKEGEAPVFFFVSSKGKEDSAKLIIKDKPAS